METLINFSSNPNNQDRTKILPNYTPVYGTQLKRGYKPQRNSKCLCGSGLKFKKCCKELETITPYMVYDGINPRVLDPAEEAARLEREAKKNDITPLGG